MTGYGAASGQAGTVSLSVEVRSVNQRHREIKINAPREYNPWESELRRRVAETVARGRVEVSVARSVPIRAGSIGVQHDIAKAYIRAWKQLRRDYGLEGDIELSLLQGRSEIFQARTDDSDPEREVKAVLRLLGRALAGHDAERAREGAHLAEDLGRRLAAMARIVARIEKASRSLAPKLRKRLEERLRKLLDGTGLDESRVVQEAAFLADKADVTEEIVRLKSHLAGLSAALAAKGPTGKRFEFLLQEAGREINTIASKASDVDVTNLAVDAKTELEKLREQVQNVE